MTKILHPNGELTTYGPPSLSDLMWARDNPDTYEIKWQYGNPVIVEKKIKPKKRKSK